MVDSVTEEAYSFFTPGLLATDIHIQIQIILPRELSEPLWM